MKTSSVPAVTEELVADLESLAGRVTTPMVTIPLSSLMALLAERAELKADVLEYAKAFNQLAGKLARIAVSSGEISETQNLDDLLGWLEPAIAERAELKQHLAAASVDAERYRKLCTVTPYRFKKIQDGALTDGGDCLYFYSDRFDAAIDATRAAGD